MVPVLVALVPGWDLRKVQRNIAGMALKERMITEWEETQTVGFHWTLNLTRATKRGRPAQAISPGLSFRLLLLP